MIIWLCISNLIILPRRKKILFTLDMNDVKNRIELFKYFIKVWDN